MEQHKTNQERGRKRLRGRTKAILDNQPSKAPGQDQEVKELLGPHDVDRRGTAADKSTHQRSADQDGTAQGISNRPGRDEHAFPEAATPASDSDSADPSVPQQQGGNRGGV